MKLVKALLEESTNNLDVDGVKLPFSIYGTRHGAIDLIPYSAALDHLNTLEDAGEALARTLSQLVGVPMMVDKTYEGAGYRVVLNSDAVVDSIKS